MFIVGQLSVEMRRGVISLIPMTDADTSYIKNWCPITLLNTDYKILSKAIEAFYNLAFDKLSISTKAVSSKKSHEDKTQDYSGRDVMTASSDLTTKKRSIQCAGNY